MNITADWLKRTGAVLAVAWVGAGCVSTREREVFDRWERVERSVYRGQREGFDGDAGSPEMTRRGREKPGGFSSKTGAFGKKSAEMGSKH